MSVISRVSTDPPPAVDEPETRRQVRSAPRGADRAFRLIVLAAAVSVLVIMGLIVLAAAVSVLVIMGLIGLFLLLRSTDALRKAGFSFLTEFQWLPNADRVGIAGVLTGTVLIAAVALVIAVPVAFGTALFIAEYARGRVRRVLVSLIDLMAAVPSIVYGLWGFFFLQPRIISLSRWLSDHASFLPFFRVEAQTFAASTFIAGVVVSLMIIPISCAIMREVFSQAPVGEREGAIALGATRWGVIRTVVLPFGRGGMIGGIMLGLGRALGETIAVYLIISVLFAEPGRLLRVLETGGASISSLIALRYGDSDSSGLSALLAAGLVLFLLTLVVNSMASVIVNRSRSGASTDI